ncbi:MAG: hypothetical protein WC512_03170 [Candidatus Omnitrophota bacterium]|jgi:hypothetical protein
MRKMILAAILVFTVVPFVFAQPVFKYNVNNKRDPFRPLVDKDGNILPEARPANSSVQLNLEGIVWSEGGDSYALISGTVLRVGDILGDYKVIKITEDEVTLNRAGEDIVLISRSQEE